MTINANTSITFNALEIDLFHSISIVKPGKSEEFINLIERKPNTKYLLMMTFYTLNQAKKQKQKSFSLALLSSFMIFHF